MALPPHGTTEGALPDQAHQRASPSGAPPSMPREGRSALRAGVVGNWIDNVHVFLPLTALTPALFAVAGPGAAATTGALVVIAMMLGRPVGGVVFGRISDRLGRTRTTKLAISGTAACAFLIACIPTYELLGIGTIGMILVLRFLGGIFVAGEYSAAIPLAMEWSAPTRRGLMSGLILSMAPWAQASIAFAVTGLMLALGPDAYAQWGWRVLFIIGTLLSLGMLLYYRRRVADAPAHHRRRLRSTAPGVSVREVLLGRWAPAFWQVFVVMSGLWLLTNTTVIILTSRLSSDGALTPTSASAAIGLASIAQAVFMAIAGHVSTRTGRRSLLVVWGLVAAVAGPFVWWAAVNAASLGQAALLAAILQVITVSAYGPIAAYLTERFPTEVRSTGYGMGYSLSLIIPALYPFYLPLLEQLLGAHQAIMCLVALGGLLVAGGALAGPRLARREIDADIDEVAAGTRTRGPEVLR